MKLLKTYSDKKWKTKTIKTNSEILRLRSKLCQNIVVKIRLALKNVAQLLVVEKQRLVKIAQFL